MLCTDCAATADDDGVNVLSRHLFDGNCTTHWSAGAILVCDELLDMTALGYGYVSVLVGSSTTERPHRRQLYSISTCACFAVQPVISPQEYL